MRWLNFVISVMFDAFATFVAVTAVFLACSVSMTKLSILLFIGAALILLGKNFTPRIRKTTATEYKMKYQSLLQIPRSTYIALLVMQVVLFILAVYITFVRGAVTLPEAVELLDKTAVTVDAEYSEEDIEVLAAVYRVVPVAVQRAMTSQLNLALDVYNAIGSVDDVDIVIMADEFTEQRIYCMQIQEAIPVYLLITIITWILYSMCSYPARVLNTYLALKKREGGTSD